MNRERSIEEYEDLLSMSYLGPQRHPHMSMRERAAQFAPFAALTGYDAVVKERERKINQEEVDV